MKNILHVGSCAGVAQTLAHEQHSKVALFEFDKFNYGADYYFPMDYSPISRLKKINILRKLIPEYDLIHFHYSTGLPFNLDIPLWFGQEIAMHYHGSDIRGRKPSWLMDKHADFQYVSTPDLLEFAPNAEYIPNPIDLTKYKIGAKHEGPLNVVHAPSNRGKKGTDTILLAIKNLSEEYDFNFQLVEGRSHREALEIYKNADIIIDQLLIGWYGLVSIEAMALGKPVCCFIHPDLDDYELPIINSTEESVYNDLCYLIEDEDARRGLGLAGRRYVENVHDVKKVVKRLYK